SGHVGAGINLLRDHAGLLTTYKLMATYSYHINLGDDHQRLHFGISAGGVQHRLDYQGVSGDLNDPSLYNYNQDNSMKFEADAGAAYTDGKLNLQVAFPNIIANARKEPGNVINRTTFFSAASYQWKPAGGDAGVSITPKVAYRRMKGTDDILDAGINIGFLGEVLNVYGLYHSTKNLTAGFNLHLFGQLDILAGYTTQTKELKSSSNGDLSFGLRYSF
ncbi:MAG TPA: type IX secretion system membrane protein PorP/SprF, partial [Chitinophaga sp.]